MKLKGIAFIYDFDIRTPLGHGDVGYLHCKFRSFLTGSKGKHNVSFPVVCRSNGKTAAHAHTGQPRVRTTKHTAVVQSLRNYKYTCQYPDVSLLTYSLTPWCRILFEKLIVTELIKKYRFLYGTRRFITAFTKARHWTVPQPAEFSQPHQSLSPLCLA
jgi:hypothetical protein